MSAAPTPPTKPSVGLWLATLLITLGGLFSGVIGLGGLVFMLEPPPVYDVASPPKEGHYDAMRVVNGFCRFDQQEEVKGRDECVVPLTAHDDALTRFDDVPLLALTACGALATDDNAAAAAAGKPAPCAPLGKIYGLDVHDDELVSGLKARYPGFTGQVLELSDPKDAQEDRMIMLGLGGIGAVAGLGGLYVLVLLWRRRKRAVAAET